MAAMRKLKSGMKTIQAHVWWVALAMVLLAGMTNPALAHRPYFTHMEKITLPDGNVGEMRLLRGDGIVFSDPGRVLVVDAAGRLLARSPRFFLLVILCQPPRECRVVDLDKSHVLELDPATFRTGAVVPSDPDLLWDFESGEASWGFQARDATFAELIEANIAMALQFPISLLILTGCGLLGVAIVFVGRFKPTEDWVTNWIVRGLLFLLRLLGVGAVLKFSLLMVAIAGISTVLWFASLLAGALLMGVSLWIWRRHHAVHPA
jgi:hypothetical protein